MCWGLFKLGCLCWRVHIGFSSWGVQVCAFKLGCLGGFVLWILGFHLSME
jgi:hypothetical protein